MPAHAHKLCSIALALVVWVAVGCGDDAINDPTIVSVGNTDTGASDTRPDVVDAGSDAGATDERCQGLQSGARCELPHASGVCVDGQCQFLSCEAGFRDCDADVDNGCEADITTADECGVCGVSCTEAESCQRSRAGWVCSVSPICPDARYDLDGDSDNGCEWSAQWGEDGIFDPVSIQPHVAAELASGAFSVAGRTLDARVVLSTGATSTTVAAEPIATELDDTVEAHAIETLAASDDTPLAAVAWTDAVTLSAASGSASDDGVFRFSCDQSPRQFNSVAASASSAIFAATAREVLQIERGAGCSLDDTSASSARQLCDAPSAVFGMADYVEAYVPAIDPTTCDACLPDTTVCPAFRPIGLTYLAASAQLVVFTERGFVILETSDSGFVAGARFETDETGQGVTRYAAGAAVEDAGTVHVYLLTTDGVLRRFEVDGDTTIRPAGPDVRLLIGARDPARLVPTSDGTLLIYDARDAWLIEPLERSARIEQLSEPNIFLGDERIVFGAGQTPSPTDEFSLLYFGVGRYYLRDVERDAVAATP